MQDSSVIIANKGENLSVKAVKACTHWASSELPKQAG